MKMLNELPRSLGLAGGNSFWRERPYWLLLLAGSGLAYVIGAHHALAISLVISLVVLQPVMEELFFRGFMQSNLLDTSWGKRRLAGVSQANLVTSLLFVVLHFLHHSPAWAVAVFLPSLVFGFVRERYQSIYPAILLHMAYNAGYFAG